MNSRQCFAQAIRRFSERVQQERCGYQVYQHRHDITCRAGEHIDNSPIKSTCHLEKLSRNDHGGHEQEYQPQLHH